MKYSIWKIPANISTFSFAPTNKEIQYEFSSSDQELAFSKDEKVLLLSKNPNETINVGITIVENAESRFKFSKDFEVSKGVSLKDISSELQTIIASSDSNYIELSEEEYQTICSKICLNNFKFPQRTITTANNVDKDLLTKYIKFITAIRTKPFLLLAGISGTGKSQIVKEMAFATCPKIDELRKSNASPGNYCLIEVKPNWHDSTELLGYDSAIKKHYVITKFIKFVVKAMRYPDVPFFVCLDEMNLAPVEQYFAEFLSVLESRKLVDGKIISEPLIDKAFFKNNLVALDLFDLPISQFKSLPVSNVDFLDEALGENVEIWNMLQEEGLCIPQNLIVIGTVNMDETTHQFSRKVIDRAMTFEMNEANFMDYFTERVTLEYSNKPLDADLFLSRHVSGNEAINELSIDKDKFKVDVAEKLDSLNSQLKDTPFKIAYRVQNELVLYYVELFYKNTVASQESVLETALDDIMMMKVLPRIEGDDELLGTKDSGKLHDLYVFTQKYHLNRSAEKINEMLGRLGSHFTSFWP